MLPPSHAWHPSPAGILSKQQASPQSQQSAPFDKRELDCAELYSAEPHSYADASSGCSLCSTCLSSGAAPGTASL